MSIRENIEKQYKQSIIEKKSSLTNTLRLIKSAIKDKDIAARSSKDKEVIKDTEILNLLSNSISGHTLKHLAATAALICILRMLTHSKR